MYRATVHDQKTKRPNENGNGGKVLDLMKVYVIFYPLCTPFDLTPTTNPLDFYKKYYPVYYPILDFRTYLGK